MESFEKASRLKLRFESNKGSLSVEELWDLSLTSLNDIFKKVSKVTREEDEESLMVNKSKRETYNGLRLEIVKHIFQTKSAEDEASKTRAESREKLARLKEIAANKAVEAFAAQGMDEILKQIAELEKATV